jgi:uncharacterized protein involved in response to NO
VYISMLCWLAAFSLFVVIYLPLFSGVSSSKQN